MSAVVVHDSVTVEADEAGLPRLRRTRRALSAFVALALLSGVGSGVWLLAQQRQDRPTVAALLQAGLAAQRQGDLLTAKGIFLEVVDREPDNAIALFDLGVLAQAAGEDDDALRRYRAAASADPKLVDAIFNEATVLAATDRAAAADAYRRVIAVEPGRAAAHLNLGLILAERGSLADAKSQLGEALRLDPSLRSRVPAVYVALIPKP